MHYALPNTFFTNSGTAKTGTAKIVKAAVPADCIIPACFVFFDCIVTASASALRDVDPRRVANVDAKRESGTKTRETGTDRYTAM